MNRDWKTDFIVVCIVAVVLTVMGFFMLDLQFSDTLIAKRSFLVVNLADSLQEVVRNVSSEGKEGVRRALRTWRGGEGVREPTAVFIWTPAKDAANRLVWASEELSKPERNLIEKKSKWNEWTAEGVKRPRRGLMRVGASHVLWGRVDNEVYGVVFDEFPFLKVATRFKVVVTEVILFALFLCVFSTGSRVLMRAVRKEKRENEMKTGFVSNCTHELKTPLTGIGIWIELLRSGKLETDEKRSRAYGIIAKENARMVRLVESLLDFSRLEKGKRKYVLEGVDVSALASEVVELQRDNFAKHGIELRVSEGCNLHTDSDAVKQILMNLVGNAAKYAADEGLVEVEVLCDGKVCRVAVSDRGPGIASENASRIFDRFYRVDDALNSKTNGLGLGLSISRALAEGLGGRLLFSARDGGGSVFTLELPIEVCGGIKSN